jgi:hypothetical protein
MNHSTTHEAPKEDFHWTWALGGAVITVAVLGVLAGRLSTPAAPPPAPPTGFAFDEGRVVASGEVQRALDKQTAASSAGKPVAVQLGFVDTLGAYCRTFSTAANAGLACREGADWVVHLIVDAPPIQAGEVREASALPQAVLAEVDRRIVGAALDAKAEAQALERGWEK